MDLVVLAKELVEKNKQFRELVLPYWKVLLDDYQCPHVSGSLDSIDFDDNVVILVTSIYDEACGCHPEYREVELRLFFEELSLTSEEFAAGRKRIREEKKVLREKEKQANSKRAAEDKKQREMAELQRLQDKYGVEKMEQSKESEDAAETKDIENWQILEG